MSDNGGTFVVIPLASFDASDINTPVSAIDNVEMASFSVAFQQASHVAQSPSKEVYALLSAITGIHINPAERGRPWRPSITFADNSRSMIPSDIRGEQSDVLETVMSRVNHPALRARVADVVWSNDLRKSGAASTAIDAYCECVERLTQGTLKAAYGDGPSSLFDAKRFSYRALQIASAIRKKGAVFPDRIVAMMKALYAKALADGQPVAFCKIAQLCVDYGILEAKTVAIDAEAVATINPSLFPDANRMAFDYATILYQRVGDSVSEQRCALLAVSQLLRMRDQVPQAGAKASWIMDALLRLRHIKGDEAVALETALEDELRRYQHASLREMGTFAVDIIKQDEVERITELFSKMDFPTAMKSFALLDASPKTEDLKSEARKLAEASPLNSMMAVKHIDSEGRIAVNTPGSGDSEPPDDWYVHMIGRSESIRRAMIAANNIEPIRILLNTIVPIEERHIYPIVWQSHFVPESQAPIWALGLARFFQGDFISAPHLLIPQLEPSLRHLLRAHGADPSKRRDDASEEDRSLDALINNHRQTLVNILGEPLLDELNRLFNMVPGPALRHDVAHGKMTSGECYTADPIYACWLLYRVCVLFLIQHWDDLVRPALTAEEPGR